MRQSGVIFGSTIVLSLAVAAAARTETTWSPWEWISPSPRSVSLEKAVYGNGRFVAVDPYGPAMTSEDGVKWATHRSRPPVDWTPLGWSRGVFWGSRHNAIGSSADGLTWTERFTAECEFLESCGVALHAMADNAELMVVVGSRGDYHPTGSYPAPVVLTSSDGATWVEEDLGDVFLRGDLRAVIWDGAQFVAAGTQIVTSPDGVHWDLRGGPAGSWLAWSGREYLVSNWFELHRSIDLVAWEPIAPPGGVVRGLLWTGTAFVGGGASDSVVLSLDGREWSTIQIPGGGDIASFAVGDGLVVGVGSNVVWSADGSNWGALITFPVADRVAAMVPWGGGALAVGWGGAILATADGRAWPRLESPTDRGLWAVTVASWGLVAVGDEGTIVTSDDGIRWRSQESGTAVTLADVAADGAVAVALGSGPDWGPVVLRSVDGASWDAVDLPIPISSPRRVSGVTAGGGRFVMAVTYAGATGVGALLTSEDGLTWSVSEFPGVHLDDVVWGNGRFLASGTRPLVSSDGVTWTEGHWPEDRPPTLVVWTGTEFALWGIRPGAWRSTDGLAWVPGPDLVPPDGGGASAFVATGTFRVITGSGTVVRSQCGTSTTAWLPGTAHVVGANVTSWRSDADLHNAGGETAAVEIELEPRGAKREDPVSVVRSVGPGETVHIEDAVWALFGYEGAATLRLQSWGGELRAQARTYNAAATGTFGQYIPALRESDAVGVGEEARLLMLAESLDPSGGFRSNLGLVNLSDIEVEVDVELDSGSGLLLSRFTRTLAARESAQLDRVLAGVAVVDVLGGYVVLRTPTPGGGFLAYLSVIDNRTGDPVFVLPAVAAEPGESLWLPGAAHGPGQLGSEWRTDAVVHATGPANAAFGLTLLPWADSEPGELLAALPLPAGTTMTWWDVVWIGFGATGGATLRVDVAGGPIMAASRTYNVGPGGTYGQYIPGLPGARAAEFPDTLSAFGLREDGSFRSNLGLVNASDTAINVAVELYDDEGRRRGRFDEGLEGYGSLQLERVLSRAGLDRGSAVVWTTTLGGRLFAYASVIDNRSNDPIYVPAR